MFRMTDKTPNTTAEYLATMCDQLAVLAEREGLEVGAHLLKMARLEFAEQVEAGLPPATRENR
jgi:hypothetical protein